MSFYRRSTVRRSFIFVVMFLGVFTAREASRSEAAAVRVLIVTGGHDYDEAAFFSMFHRMKDLVWTHTSYGQGAEEMLNPSGTAGYDAILFYDMHQQKEPQWKGIMQLLEQGKGIVFLHHALWSYDESWDEYAKIVGGRASNKPRVVPGPSSISTYKHDTAFRVHVVDPSHPITRNMSDFEIVDEVYNHYWVDPSVHPLLTTDSPESTPTIAWTHTYLNSRIVYLELGHGPSGYDNPSFQRILDRALAWVAGKLE